MRDRVLGALLFLPVPIVLFLFTRAPLGVVPSLVLGALLMVTHRLYARPFSLAAAPRRCLWCGSAASGPSLEVVEPLGRTTWRTCSQAHAESLGRVLGWAGRHARALRVGILGTLAVFLPLALLLGAGRLHPLASADAVAFFRLGIAATVLPLGFLSLGAAAATEGQRSVPFPVHIQALIGTWAVLWLFRVIGLAWLALGALHVAQRLGLS